MVRLWVMRWGRVVGLRGMVGWAVWCIRLMGWCMGLVPILGSRGVAI